MKAIQATPLSLKAIFWDKQFVIPEFQRSYSWGEEECELLWDDISNFCQKAKPKDQYFLGSIVVYYKGKSSSDWHIIDGQQRLITLMILIKVLFDKASTMKILEKFLYKQDPNTGDVIREKPRLISKVQAGSGRDEANDLQVTILGEGNFVDPKNNFKQNYEKLRGKVSELWEGKTAANHENFIIKFIDQIFLLPIECDSMDDALDLFQIINNRGLQLSDADIFKAQIYSAIKTQQDKSSFINRWGNLKKHDFLFRLFMYISRAERHNTGQEINMRKYILDHHLKNKHSLAKTWNSIMHSLELCHWVLEGSKNLCSKVSDIANERIYWQILERYTNVFWQYPVYVFLNKHVQGDGDTEEFFLPESKHAEYLTLLRDNVRYFYIKGVVHNNVHRVRDTAFKACVAIYDDEDYTNLYKDNTSADLSVLAQELENCGYGRYRRGLVFLNSIPKSERDRVAYSKALTGNIHIEHILPRKWNNYDKWDEKSHARDVDKLGNLMPIEAAPNIAAQNEFFKRKKKEYAKSKIRAVLDLSKEEPSTWYPEDVEKRQQKTNRRLMRFFREPFGS